MATYKGIQGFAIQNLSSDPTNFITGQVWYNSTNNVFKVTTGTTQVTAAWATGGNLTTGRQQAAGAGTQTAGLMFGGNNPSGPTRFNATEEYNGSSWTNGGNLTTARNFLAGCGTQTAGLAFGGDVPTPGQSNATEEYNGSSWTNGGNLGTARYAPGGAGTQTAGLCFGGYGGGDQTTSTEEYDGSSWTGGGNMNEARS